jgi:hypothetical protein
MQYYKAPRPLDITGKPDLPGGHLSSPARTAAQRLSPVSKSKLLDAANRSGTRPLYDAVLEGRAYKPTITPHTDLVLEARNYKSPFGTTPGRSATVNPGVPRRPDFTPRDFFPSPKTFVIRER